MTWRQKVSRVLLVVVLSSLAFGLKSAVAAPAPARSTPAISTPAGAATTADDIRDIRGPIAIPRSTPAWWYLAGTVGVGAIIAVLLLAGRRKPRRLPAHDRALAALNAARPLLDGDTRVFSIAVSEAVRNYVEEAFTLRAAHRTTDELLADLMSDDSPVAAHRSELAAFLHFCDLAKFAGRSFCRADMSQMLASAEAFVRATTPVASPANIRHAALRGQGAT